MIRIYLNGESRNIDDEKGIAEMLELLSLPSQRVAVEVNGVVVRRADWPATTVKDGDRIEVVHFVGGG